MRIRPSDSMTAADIRALRFSQVKGFGRGYDTGEVDQIISQVRGAGRADEYRIGHHSRRRSPKLTGPGSSGKVPTPSSNTRSMC